MNEISDHKLEAGYDSSKTISWNAHREAEKLTDTDLIPQLIRIIEDEKNKRKRDSAYFVLGHIAKNTNNRTAVEYLIQRLDEETDKYILSSLLDRIAELDKPTGTNLKPILKAIKSDKWQIRHSAIKALKNAQGHNAEEALIEILDTSQDPYNLTYASATLNYIGTVRVIPYLEKHLRSSKRDVKASVTVKCF